MAVSVKTHAATTRALNETQASHEKLMMQLNGVLTSEQVVYTDIYINNCNTELL